MSISNELETRIKSISNWLDDEAPYTSADQKHLIEHSAEQAYWNHGYMMACADILARMKSELHTSVKSNKQS